MNYQTLEEYLGGLDAKVRDLLSETTSSNLGKKFRGDCKDVDRDVFLAGRLGASKRVAWSVVGAALPRNLAGPPSADTYLPMARREGPLARSIMEEHQEEKILHVIQSALISSWAIYEFVWVHLVGPLSASFAANETGDGRAAFLQHLTAVPDSSAKWHGAGWAKYALRNVVRHELELLWSLRCILVHDPGALVDKAWLQQRDAGVWDVDMEGVVSALEARGKMSSPLRDYLNSAPRRSSGLDALRSADAKVDRVLT